MHLDIAGELLLKVEDNGICLDPETLKIANASGRGLGLFNIENRVHLLGARMDYSQFESHGTRITLTAPLL